MNWQSSTVCGAVADAQAEYFSQPHDGEKDETIRGEVHQRPWQAERLVLEVAGRTAREPARAAGGVRNRRRISAQSPKGHTAFHGYYFRMLKGQTDKAPGGAKDYVVNGKMTGGFAFVAYPAEYGNSGVMTFIINQDGVLLQKDLGKTTTEIATAMTEFDPDPSWTIVE